MKGALVFLTSLVAATQAIKVSVGSSGGKAVSPLQYGAMFEDINHSGEGGLYAELVQNRAFQGAIGSPSNLNAWSSVNGALLSLKNLTKPLSSALPTSMNVVAGGYGHKQVGFANR